VILNGCWTPDDVKQTGVVWSGTYVANYDQLARCLSAQTTPYYKAALQLNTDEHRARVTYAIPVTGIPVEVYDLRETANNTTQISWSTRLERNHGGYGPLYLMQNCGAAPLAATASAPPAPTAQPTPLQPSTWAPEQTPNTPTNR
jgi:hypothetical protein